MVVSNDMKRYKQHVRELGCIVQPNLSRTSHVLQWWQLVVLIVGRVQIPPRGPPFGDNPGSSQRHEVLPANHGVAWRHTGCCFGSVLRPDYYSYYWATDPRTGGAMSLLSGKIGVVAPDVVAGSS